MEKPAEVVLSDEFSPPPRQATLDAEFQKALQVEKDLYQAVRDSEREMQDIVSLRKREEQVIILEKSVFETAREKAKENTVDESAVEIQEEKDENHVDYLTPFLQNVHDISAITLEEAEDARDECLKAMKERLLERANIIQCRLDEENSLLAKKQAAFQRNRDHVEGADDEFERFCAEAMFRIQILEQRLSQHEETALQKYANLDQKLRQDPRLTGLNAK
uniref:Dynein regulatory complex subunit 7 C-terminal domain-containing protein n=1 Tax=Aplanochytrium stocchinoi TaxID=215587 RepID=A0A7S3LLB9_9STRA